MHRLILILLSASIIIGTVSVGTIYGFDFNKIFRVSDRLIVDPHQQGIKYEAQGNKSITTMHPDDYNRTVHNYSKWIDEHCGTDVMTEQQSKLPTMLTVYDDCISMQKILKHTYGVEKEFPDYPTLNQDSSRNDKDRYTGLYCSIYYEGQWTSVKCDKPDPISYITCELPDGTTWTGIEYYLHLPDNKDRSMTCAEVLPSMKE